MSDKKNYYYNRALSWMDFNARVLEEAQKKDNPLMERLRFLAITGSNLDEFFMVRVAGVKSQIASNYTKPDDSGMTPKELLSALDKKTHAFMEKQYSCLYRSILPVLKKQAEIEFRTPEKLTHEQRAFTDEYFHRVLFPVLTPLAVDSSRPFPMLANKSLNLAVRLSSKENKGEKCFAVVQVPSILPRFTELPADGAPQLLFDSTAQSCYYYAGSARFANLGSSDLGGSFVTTVRLEEGEMIDMTYTTDPADYIQLGLTPFSQWNA